MGRKEERDSGSCKNANQDAGTVKSHNQGRAAWARQNRVFYSGSAFDTRTAEREGSCKFLISPTKTTPNHEKKAGCLD